MAENKEAKALLTEKNNLIQAELIDRGYNINDFFNWLAQQTFGGSHCSPQPRNSTSGRPKN